MSLHTRLTEGLILARFNFQTTVLVSAIQATFITKKYCPCLLFFKFSCKLQCLWTRKLKVNIFQEILCMRFLSGTTWFLINDCVYLSSERWLVYLWSQAARAHDETSAFAHDLKRFETIWPRCCFYIVVAKASTRYWRLLTYVHLRVLVFRTNLSSMKVNARHGYCTLVLKAKLRWRASPSVL